MHGWKLSLNEGASDNVLHDLLVARAVDCHFLRAQDLEANALEQGAELCFGAHDAAVGIQGVVFFLGSDVFSHEEQPRLPGGGVGSQVLAQGGPNSSKQGEDLGVAQVHQHPGYPDAVVLLGAELVGVQEAGVVVSHLRRCADAARLDVGRVQVKQVHLFELAAKQAFRDSADSPAQVNGGVQIVGQQLPVRFEDRGGGGEVRHMDLLAT